MDVLERITAPRRPKRIVRRTRPARPAYLDYPYRAPEPAFSWWDDYKHYIWGIVIAAVVFFGAYAIWEDAKKFSLFDKLC